MAVQLKDLLGRACATGTGAARRDDCYIITTRHCPPPSVCNRSLMTDGDDDDQTTMRTCWRSRAPTARRRPSASSAPSPRRRTATPSAAWRQRTARRARSGSSRFRWGGWVVGSWAVTAGVRGRGPLRCLVVTLSCMLVCTHTAAELRSVGTVQGGARSAWHLRGLACAAPLPPLAASVCASSPPPHPRAPLGFLLPQCPLYLARGHAPSPRKPLRNKLQRPPLLPLSSTPHPNPPLEPVPLRPPAR